MLKRENIQKCEKWGIKSPKKFENRKLEIEVNLRDSKKWRKCYKIQIMRRQGNERNGLITVDEEMRKGGGKKMAKRGGRH